MPYISTTHQQLSNSSLSLANERNNKSPKSDIRILREICVLTWRLCENHIKFCWNWMMRLCSRGKQTLGTTLGPIAYSYWAKRRALYSALLSTIIFHALQDSLKLWISKKRSWVSNAVSAPISTFAAPTNKFGTKTLNCTSSSKYNAKGAIKSD